MSRLARKQMLSMTDSLIRANKVLKTSLSQTASGSETIIQLLADCQDAAISLGENLEKILGQDTEIVTELETYCENLYQMTLLLEHPKQSKELVRTLGLQLAKIRHMIETQIPDRLEAVFLPYKVSMWDSLESIWMAADADPDCDAYVIPIPYYDKNPDGSVRKEHYEGREFPLNIPVTRYDTYDFPTRMPDMIFIHNPYDDCNHVTSVYPYFYSKNLKQFTEKLIYVPYFVLNGEEIDENYSTPPAVFYADYIIAQTEAERQDYIRHCSKLYPEGNFEKKVLALGSPKFDKACSVNRDNVSVPEKWLEKIKDKKVIFYNTSLNAMLKDSDAYLEKMEDVFAFFGSREDAVLLWRPHPLMESTLLSMRPELYMQYMDLKERFQREEIGIYDDTPDMYTAIGLSDGYYGDWSSLVWLYRATGKPVMIQEVSVKSSGKAE